MGFGVGASSLVTPLISEDPPGEYDERVLGRTKIAVPARCWIEHVAKRQGQALGIRIGSLELDERPDPGLTRLFVPASTRNTLSTPSP